MINDVDQMSGAVTYYAAKINGQIIGGQYLTETIASEYGSKMCKEGDQMTIVPVTSGGQEILLG